MVSYSDEKFDNTFGFKLGKPCIMLRLNKVNNIAIDDK